MVIPDSSAWIEYFNGVINWRTEWMNDNTHLIATADLILMELLQGIRSDKQFEFTLNRMSHLEIFELGGRYIAITAARNYLGLRRRGITIRKPIDCIIATFCIENGHTLLHNDRDFDPFEKHLGLRVLYPS